MNSFLIKIKKNKLVNNFIVLLTGSGITSILSMVSLALIVRSVGLELNGIILSVGAYCQLMNNIFGFKSAQALIKYLTFYLEKNNENMIKICIYQSYFLDIIGVVAATVFGFIFLGLYGKFMNWNHQIINYCKIFLIAYLFQIQGTAIGVLRVYNKFNFITYNSIVVSAVRVIGYFIGFILKLEFKYFLILDASLIILHNLILNVFTFIILKKNKLHNFYKENFKIDKEFFMFNFYNNISSTIDIPVGTLTTIFINRYLGYTEISVYKIFERIGAMVSKIGSPINQIIYPELNRYVVKKDFKKAKKVANKFVVCVSLVGVVLIAGVYITHKVWLGIFIEDYERYIGPLLFYLLFTVFVNATIPIYSLFLALNYVKYNIPILLVVNLIYLIVLYPLIVMFGLNGVILALSLQAVAVIAIKVIIMKKNDYQENNIKRHIA